MSNYDILLARVRAVRRKWRLQALVRGVSLFLASTVALLVLGIWGADLFGFRAGAVWVMRILTGSAVVYVAVRFFLLPLRRKITDVQVAQFIEERYPQLEDRLVTAVEFGDSSKISSGMFELLIRDALNQMRRVDFSVFVDRRRIAAYSAAGAGSFLALLALLNWGPSFFPYGFDRLYVPWAEASVQTRSTIMVVPGNVEVARGTDQQIKAQLIGFDSPDVRLFIQAETATAWAPLEMEPEPRGSGFLYLLLDLQSSLKYYVEAKGVRSSQYTIRVVDVPRVDSISLTYNFPPYTGMAAQTVEGEGDISALKGTRIGLKVRMTEAVNSARLVFDNRTVVDLKPVGNKLYEASFTLSRSGAYFVQLAGSMGGRYSGSPEYDVEAVEDMPPTVSIVKPMRDVRATNVEEVFSELRGEDDIGMGKLELNFSVNGGPEQVVTLHGGRPARQQVTGAHTFFLEEYGLQAGDVISYYGRATDNNNITGPGTSSTDIYFIQIRPFEQEYTQSQQGGMPGAGGEASQEALSKQQKDIISATFKLIRDKEGMDPKEYRDSLKSLALVQSRLQAQAQGLVDRLQRRGAAEVGSDFVKLAEYLRNALGDMERAALQLGAEKPKEALPDEQKALQQLMRAESLFREIQVSFSQGAGGGQGGSEANAEDLADLFELELNKLKNQYETIQRGEQQARDQKMDEALQRLKELAQRQQQVNERNRMMAGQRGGSSPGSSGGGQGQQQLMEETEKLQRELQRLSRERSSPELNRVSNQLQQALNEMKKALSGQQSGNRQEGAAQGMRALQQLEDARRALERNRNQGLSSGMDQALGESRGLLEEQKKVEEGIQRLSQEKAAGGEGPASQQRKEDLMARKNAMAERLKNLGNKIQDLSRQARQDNKQTAGKLGDAAGLIRDKRLPERIQSGNQLLQGGYYDLMKGREEFIRGNLEDLAGQLESARNSIGQTQEDKLEDAVNRARQLAEGLESMEQRLRRSQGRQQGAGPQQARRGEPGQPGEGRPGESGQAQQGEGQQAGRGQEGSGEPGSPQSGQTPGRAPGDNPGSGSPADGLGRTGDAYGPPVGVGPYRDAEGRQFGRETHERLLDAQDLRRMLDRNSTEMKNLDQVIEALRLLDAGGNFTDPQQVARLKAAIDMLRQVELDLSRDLSRITQKEKYFYAEDSEAPTSYKKLVEEYYKALARAQQK